MTEKRIYLAGPDVFFANAAQHFSTLKAKCAAAGFVGVEPADGGISEGFKGSPRELAHRIYAGNMERIRNCDAMIANLQPFRSAIEPDSGTVWEASAGVAREIPVCGYLPDHSIPMEQKIAAHFGVRRDEKGIEWDLRYNLMVEAMEMPVNLMLAASIDIVETFDDALEVIRKKFSLVRRCSP